MTSHCRTRAAKLSALLAIIPISHVALGTPHVDNLALPSRVVDFADLDITRNVGVTTLYLRIVAAAHHVCDPHIFQYRDIRLSTNAERCLRQAVDKAVTDVNVPALTAYYLAKANKRAGTGMVSWNRDRR